MIEGLRGRYWSSRWRHLYRQKYVASDARILMCIGRGCHCCVATLSNRVRPPPTTLPHVFLPFPPSDASWIVSSLVPPRRDERLHLIYWNFCNLLAKRLCATPGTSFYTRLEQDPDTAPRSTDNSPAPLLFVEVNALSNCVLELCVSVLRAESISLSLSLSFRPAGTIFEIVTNGVSKDTCLLRTNIPDRSKWTNKCFFFFCSFTFKLQFARENKTPHNFCGLFNCHSIEHDNWLENYWRRLKIMLLRLLFQKNNCVGAIIFKTSLTTTTEIWSQMKKGNEIVEHIL